MHEGEKRSIITSTTGGILTKEVGTVTGDLEVATRLTDTGAIDVTVRYAGAEEWYVVEGGPIKPGDVGGLALSNPRKLHAHIVEHLMMPGQIVEGNEEAISLHGFSPIAG